MNQRQRYHIAVADVRHFMRQNGFDFIAGHVVEQAGADSDERAVFGCAGCKGVRLRRVVNGYFRRFQIPLTGLRFNSCQQPSFFFALWVVDDDGADRMFGDGFRHQQGDNRAAEADDGGISQQAADLVGTVDAQDGQNNTDDNQNCDISCDK